MSESRDVTLVKLGGSLITDKQQPETARPAVLTRLAGELKQALDESPAPVVIGHGSGSFGHVTASRYDIQLGVEKSDQIPGVSATQQSAFHLHFLVVSALRQAGVAAFSLMPSSFVVARAGEPDEVWPAPLVGALNLGLVPVVFGDVVMDREWGASICSTEKLFLALAPALGSRGLFVKRAIWLGETPGVYDDDGQTIERIEVAELPALIERTSGAAGTDVTGGMRHRLETVGVLADLGISSWLGNGLEVGSLSNALVGVSSGGTEITPGRG